MYGLVQIKLAQHLFSMQPVVTYHKKDQRYRKLEIGTLNVNKFHYLSQVPCARGLHTATQNTYSKRAPLR